MLAGWFVTDSCSAICMHLCGDIPSDDEASLSRSTVFIPSGLGTDRLVVRTEDTAPGLDLACFCARVASSRLKVRPSGLHHSAAMVMPRTRRVVWSSQNLRGTKAKISWCRATQSASVGVWHGLHPAAAGKWRVRVWYHVVPWARHVHACKPPGENKKVGQRPRPYAACIGWEGLGGWHGW